MLQEHVNKCDRSFSKWTQSFTVSNWFKVVPSIKNMAFDVLDSFETDCGLDVQYEVDDRGNEVYIRIITDGDINGTSMEDADVDSAFSILRSCLEENEKIILVRLNQSDSEDYGYFLISDEGIKWNKINTNNKEKKHE